MKKTSITISSASILKASLMIISLFLFFSCDKPKPVDEGQFNKGDGFFILNEGGYGQANASVSYRFFEGDSTENLIYESINGEKLGDILQSMTIHNSYAYLIVNNSAYIKVVDANSFEKVATIEGFTSPRYMQVVNDREAYVSDLLANKIWVVNLKNNVISDSIAVDGWTEEMVMAGGKVYVTSPSSWGKPPSKNIVVIDPVTHTVESTIEVPVNPVNIIKESENKIWVFCQGDAFGDPVVKPSLVRFDTGAPQFVQTFLALADLPLAYTSRLVIDAHKENVYFLYGSIYRLSVDDNMLSGGPFIQSNGRSLYALGIDPVTDEVYTSDVKGFDQSGTIFQYDTSGNISGQFNTGIGSSGFYFY